MIVTLVSEHSVSLATTNEDRMNKTFEKQTHEDLNASTIASLSRVTLEFHYLLVLQHSSQSLWLSVQEPLDGIQWGCVGTSFLTTNSIPLQYLQWHVFWQELCDYASCKNNSNTWGALDLTKPMHRKYKWYHPLYNLNILVKRESSYSI